MPLDLFALHICGLRPDEVVVINIGRILVIVLQPSSNDPNPRIMKLGLQNAIGIEGGIWYQPHLVTTEYLWAYKAHWNTFPSARRYLGNNDGTSRWHILNMKSCRFICDFPSSSAFTCKPVFTNLLYSLSALGELLQL